MNATPVVIYAQVIVRPAPNSSRLNTTFLMLVLAAVFALTGVLFYVVGGPVLSDQVAALIGLAPTSIGLGFSLAAAAIEVIPFLD
jgi:uncharacterized membrane protein